MDHLTAAQIVDLIGGEESVEGQQHLASCSRCRELRKTWTRRLTLLRDLERESLDEAELHRLRVMYRQLGPARSKGAHWLARLVRDSGRRLAAIRGIPLGTIREYEAGPYTLVLRVGPVDRTATVSVHGQLTTSDGEVGRGTLALSAEDGRAYLSEVDRFGEFHLREVPAGRYRALWWLGEAAIEVEDLEIGEDEGS